MRLVTEHKPVMAVSLNTAWQKILLFPHLDYGNVNRARCLIQCGGGKGVNVARALRRLGYPVIFAGFRGGPTGKLLAEEFAGSGVRDISQETAAVTRTCCTVVSEDDRKVTELIEPSEPVTSEENACLLDRVLSEIPGSGAVLFVGSVPPGVSDDFSAQVASGAAKHGIPFVLDAVKGLDQILRHPCRLLKVNADELRAITGTESLQEGARRLFGSFPALESIGVTDGPRPASFFTRDHHWCLEISRLENVVNPIGGGDCTDAIITLRISQGLCPEELPRAFGEALAYASASCLTDIPAVFDPEVAENLAGQIRISES